MAGQSQRAVLEANARLKCVYFPMVEGEESIKRILDKLGADGCGIRESFESFSRVSVRRLGRLLPDSRWALLPFMEPKLKIGEKGQSLKRKCSRVKCFVDTDSGFNPTPHKTDLVHNHPYTKALKNFGNRTPENENEVQVEIFRNGKKLTLTEVQKQYYDWISEMHDRYDDEIDAGLDQPTLVVVSSKIRKLDISSDVLRVHKKIQRKGKIWTAGQNIKVLKGACGGCHKTNVYATLEYIILQGLQGDACGEARLICRPLGMPEDRGCLLLVRDGNNTIDIRDSLVLPIRIIDSEKCIPIDGKEWTNKLEAHSQKLPSAIDLLSHIECQQLEIEGGLPSEVEAGQAPPENVVAVIRPNSFNSENSSKRMDQKFIVRDNLQMSLEIKSGAGGREYVHIFSMIMPPSSHKGLHGLYVFPLRERLPKLFEKASLLTLSFSLNEPRHIRLQQVVQVEASAEGGRWKIVNLNRDEFCTIRVGSCFSPLRVGCFDKYNNRVPFTSIPKLTIKLISNGVILAEVRSKRVELIPRDSTLRIKEFFVRSSRLDDIRPNYEATLHISTLDEAFFVAVPCRVLPGAPHTVILHPPNLSKQVIPGQIIKELSLEVIDEYGNHAKEDDRILLRVDGFSFEDGSGIARRVGIECRKKVDANGFVDLSNTLKVSKGYGRKVQLSVISRERTIFSLDLETEKRELRSAQQVFQNCEAGTQLENVVFEIVNSQGEVDESVHDEEKHGQGQSQSHTLTIKSKSLDIDDDVRYSFCHGRCTIPSIPLPQREGTFSFSAAHSRYPDLHSVIKVHVVKARQESCNSIRNHEDAGNLELSAQRLCENEQILPHSPSLNTSQAMNETSAPSSNEGVSPNSSSPALKTPESEFTDARPENSTIFKTEASTSRDLGNLACSALICQKDLHEELENDFMNSGAKMYELRGELGELRDTQSRIQKDISNLQAFIDGDLGDASSMCCKELVLKQIESKSETVAAVICKKLEETPPESRPQDIVGIVALLGATESIELSRMLARYLGEDQMLAIVCRSYEAAYQLEATTEFAELMNRGYDVFCLEDIRPRCTQPTNDPQQLLNLKTPTLPDGNVAQGFLGHAVNLICIEEDDLQGRTKTGHGLRETLFYRLFGQLQVYRDRKSMMTARSYIVDGALSLDGCIMRGSGLLSFGHREPEVVFPVRSKAMPRKSRRTLQFLETKKSELANINMLIDEVSRCHQSATEKFNIVLEKYNSFESANRSSSTERSLQNCTW